MVARNAKALEREIDAWMKRYSKAMTRRVVGQVERGERLKLTGPDDKKLQDELAAILARSAIGQVDRAGKRTAKKLKGKWKLDPKVAAEIARTSKERARGIMRDTRRSVRRIVKKVNRDPRKLRHVLHGKTPEDRAFAFGPQRARLISRTEAGKNEDNGIFEGMQAAGIKEIEWLARKDGRSGDRHHERMHGKRAKIGKMFVTPLGNRLRYPKDPRAPIKEIANCRCTIRPIRRSKK